MVVIRFHHSLKNKLIDITSQTKATQNLIYKLVRESEEIRLKAVSKILASVMIERKIMSLESKLTFYKN